MKQVFRFLTSCSCQCSLSLFLFLFVLSTLVSATLDPNLCLESSQIDTSCLLYITNTSVPLLQFGTPWWEFKMTKNWENYLIQDGKYIIYYNNTIVKKIGDLCGNEMTRDEIKELQDKLGGFNATAYAERYNVPKFWTHPPSPELTDYLQHYDSQQDCPALLSSMLPCLCIYPPIAKAAAYNTTSKRNLPSTVHYWITDNATSGSTCAKVFGILARKSNMRPGPYNKSARLELEFFNQTVTTSADVNDA